MTSSSLDILIFIQKEVGHLSHLSEIYDLKDNLDLCVPIYERLAKIGMMLELEAGVVGGEEDGAAGSEDTPAEKLYTTKEDMVEASTGVVDEVLGLDAL